MVKVGDELAFRYGFSRERIYLCKVTKITPSGRIRCGNYELDPDLRIRGRDRSNYSAPFSAEIVTQEIRDKYDRQNISDSLGKVKWGDLPLESLRAIQAIVQENKKEEESE